MGEDSEKKLKYVSENLPDGLRATYYVDELGRKQGLYSVTHRPGYGRGTVRHEEYKDGVLHGWQTMYNTVYNRKKNLFNTYRTEAIRYFEGRQVERWTYWPNSDQIRTTEEYDFAGNLDGMQLEFHPNGRVSCSTEYRHGKKHGWVKKYDDKGHLISETRYEDDKIRESNYSTSTKPRSHNTRTGRTVAKKTSSKKSECKTGKVKNKTAASHRRSLGNGKGLDDKLDLFQKQSRHMAKTLHHSNGPRYR